MVLVLFGEKTTTLSRIVLIFCIVLFVIYYVIESIVLRRSLLVVPNTFMSFSPSLADSVKSGSVGAGFNCRMIR